ncbi:hypothetical protein B0O80DRAFT_65780 [Mortierella sp. GBAus27b]|nr:hypothetical protein B0O80DRAFT_65780 [Mortierella sp. GBAus27b]
MGILSPHCFTTDSNSTIYAVTKEWSFSDTDPKNKQFYWIIIKSNANPNSYSDLTWSIVATADVRALASINEVQSCAVSDQGVLTVFGYGRVSYVDTPNMIRYDPSAPATTLTTPNGETVESSGPGAWMNITVDQQYQGTSSTARLFYVKNAVTSGVKTLVHMTISVNQRWALFWTMDESTKTLKYATRWSLFYYPFSNARSFAVSDNELYLNWEKENDNVIAVTAYSLTNLTSGIAPPPRVFNGSIESDCLNSHDYYSGVWRNTYYLACSPQYELYGRLKPTMLYSVNTTVKGTSFYLLVQAQTPLYSKKHFTIVGTTPVYGIMYDPSKRQTNALVLSGPNTGSVWGPKNITVPERFGIDENARPSPPRNNSSKSSAGMIVGIILGVLAMLGIVLHCFHKYLPRNDDKETPPTRVHNRTGVNRAAQRIVRPTEVRMVRAPGSNRPYQAAQRIVRPAEVRMVRAPGSSQADTASPPPYNGGLHPFLQPAPTASLVGTRAVTTFVTSPTTQEFQSVQDQVQHLRFSSHPRPNFVTTVGEDGHSVTQEHDIETGPESMAPPSPTSSVSTKVCSEWHP